MAVWGILPRKVHLWCIDGLLKAIRPTATPVQWRHQWPLADSSYRAPGE